MKRKTNMLRITAAIMIGVFTITGCGGQTVTEKKTSESSISKEEAVVQAQNLSADIQKKYASDSKYDYADPIYNIKRDESLYITIGFKPEDKQMTEYTQVVALYQDANLTQQVGNYYDMDKESGKIEIKPPKYQDLSISNLGLKKDELGMEGSEYTLFEKEECKDWGNLGKMYMVQYVDLETGEALLKPLVTVVTVAGEVEAPTLRFTDTPEGIAGFSWDAVEGAKKYLLVEADYSPDRGYTGTAVVIGNTEETSWEAEALSGDMVFNSDFRTYSTSEDDWNDPSEEMSTYLLEKYGEEKKGKVIPKSEEYITYYGVVAVSEEGTSMLSNMYSEEDLASLLVYSYSNYTGDEKFSNYAQTGILSTPTHQWMTMCDGRNAQKLVNYDISKAEETVNQYGTYEKEDMSDMKLVDVDVVKIPYTVEGTPITGMMIVENYNKDTLTADLEALQARQDGLKSKTGNVEVNIKKGVTEEENKATTVAVTQETDITASSALSEYMAINLLAGNESIDLTSFKESSDQDYLVQAFQEARYQNPLILGIQDVGISYDGTCMYIKYEESDSDRERKQSEIKEAVTKVVGEFIKDDMTDLEKEIVINQYLCDTAEYDMGALENAAKYDYQKVDPEYWDSFTPYGVLIKKVGVCASYAASFKLLADAANLDCIVVTGYLDGSLAHAWNRVSVEGEWRTVDATNNDMPDIPNALLNLSDDAAAKVLVEDTDYAMDAAQGKYVAQKDDYEFYRLEGKYYDLDSISEKLADGLDQDGVITLRTEYDLNDKMFTEIVKATSSKANRKPTDGYYWMGVIYLSE